MKNTFLLIILFFSGFTVHAQKYVFNTLVKYAWIKSDYERVNYTNSKDDSYHLILRKTDDSFSAFLCDYKNMKEHQFKVIETKSKNEFFFEFKYIKSTTLNLESKNRFSDYYFKFENLSANDSVRKVKLYGYENSKNKKPSIEYELEIKNYPENLFHSFRIGCLHPFERIQDLNIHENGVVISAKRKGLFDYNTKYKLLELKQVNFELEVKN